jgi:hypothetical protein
MNTNLSIVRAVARGKLVISGDVARPAADPFNLNSCFLAHSHGHVGKIETDTSHRHKIRVKRANAFRSVRSTFAEINAALASIVSTQSDIIGTLNPEATCGGRGIIWR